MGSFAMIKYKFYFLGSLVTEGEKIPSGQYWAGAPAKYVRDLSVADIARITTIIQENSSLASQHAEENDKSWEIIEQELFNHEQLIRRNSSYFPRLTPEVVRFFSIFTCCLFLFSNYQKNSAKLKVTQSLDVSSILLVRS